LDGLIGSRGVSVDDWLAPTSGQQTGPTEQGINLLLCGSNSTCPVGTAPVRVNVAIWDTYGASTRGICSGGTSSSCFHIKYMGVFYVTGYDGAHGNNNIMGYFSAIGTDGGGFVPKPGPVIKNALVE
jgi:hypothetical protein